MAKLRITGLNKGKVREVNINLIQFDREALTDELADLTLELIDKKARLLLSFNEYGMLPSKLLYDSLK